jgi:opacity protein-like surface antigen
MIGRRSAAAVLLAAALLPATAAAQRTGIQVGLQGVTGSYAQDSANFRWTGTGFAGSLDVRYANVGLEIRGMKVSLDPEDSLPVSAESFDLTQIDASLRWYVLSALHAEVGFTSRKISPEFAAQEIGAVRVGLLAQYNLSQAARLRLRTHYLAAAKFSGGGSAPLALSIGLGASYRAVNAVALTVDYEFQTFRRKTSISGTDVDAPVQSAFARFGVAASF